MIDWLWATSAVWQVPNWVIVLFIGALSGSPIKIRLRKEV